MTTTTFDNFTDHQLADEIGMLDTQAKTLKARLDAAKAEFKRRNIAKAIGAKFVITRSDSVRWSLDGKAIKEAMGANWVDRHSKPSNVTTIRVAANKAALIAA